MKIEHLRAFMSRDKDRPRVIVAIDTDEGITGWGECYNRGPDMALIPLLGSRVIPDRTRSAADQSPDAVPAVTGTLSTGRAQPCRDVGDRSLPVGYLGEGIERAGVSIARRACSRSDQGVRRDLYRARSGVGARIATCSAKYFSA